MHGQWSERETFVHEATPVIDYLSKEPEERVSSILSFAF
jgi:hypothetical protein